MRQLKGISPLVASVLLVAFTMAVAAIIVTWITDFAQQQTTTISRGGEQQTACAYSTLSVSKNDVSVLGNSTNVTVTYSTGTETLNITGILVRDASGDTYVNTTSPNGDATVRNMAVGSSVKLINYLVRDRPNSATSTSWREIRVTALCQGRFVVVGTVTNL